MLLGLIGAILIIIGGLLMQLVNPPSRIAPSIFVGGCILLLIALFGS